MNRTLSLLLILGAIAAEARPPIPLMPPRLASHTESSSSVVLSTGRRSERIGLGAELGLLGKRHGSNADALGMQFLWGGRVFLRLPVVADGFYLKPSLGYFRKDEGSGSAGVTQNVFEIGATALYAPAVMRRLKWLVGLVQRVDVQFSSLSAPGTSENLPASVQYRLGPTTGIAYGLSPTSSIVVDVEMTFAFTTPVRPYGGLSAGFLFFLD